MRKSIPILCVLLLLIPCICPAADASSDDILLRFSEVYPCNDFEGFALINYGNSLDLIDYYVSDGEGTVRFTEHLTIGLGETVHFFKNEPAEWFSVDRYYLYGTSGIVAKGLTLNDSGDDLYLRHGDDLIDTFVYGSADSGIDGWKGDAFQKISKKSVAQRRPYCDTDSASDWILTVPGRTSLGTSGEHLSEVIPFTFPESKGMPVMKELQSAQERIDIAIYLISHPDIISILIDALSRGVIVNILAEGSPAGGIPDEEIKGLRSLVNLGADVRLIQQNDGYKRYSYLHCKYAVIDGCSVIITSENWLESSFGSNRGWGVVIRSIECASYLENIFNDDFDSSNQDIFSFDDKYRTSKGTTYQHVSDITKVYDSYWADVDITVSPDNTWDSMRQLIGDADVRVYSQQLDAQYAWVYSSDNPISWMKDASSRGADCRLCLDVTFDSENDEDYEDGYGVIEWLESTTVTASPSGFDGLTHNKGVIADDRVWVGSVNWTENSFAQNREVAVIIDSAEVSDYYASYFLQDWGDTYSGEVTLRIECDRTVLKEGEAFILDASSSVTDQYSVFSWDTDGDGTADRSGKRIALSLGAGEHDITLFVTDGIDTYTMAYPVDVQRNDDNELIAPKYIPIVLICITVLAVKVYLHLRRTKHDR